MLNVCRTGRAGERLIFVSLLSCGCCEEWRCVAFYCPMHSCVGAVYRYHTSLLCVYVVTSRVTHGAVYAKNITPAVSL